MSQPRRDRLLDVLLHESEQVRDDDRYVLTQYPVLITVALTLVIAMAALYTNTYPQGYPPDSGPLVQTIRRFLGIGPEGLTPVPIWVYLACPLLPIVLISYVAILGNAGALRNHYLRVVERKIHKMTLQGAEELPIPSWGHLQLYVTGQTNSSGLLQPTWILIYGILTLLLLGCVFLLTFKVPPPLMRLRIFGFVINGGLTLIPVAVGALGAGGGARLWQDALEGLGKRLQRTDDCFHTPRKKDERSLPSFLLLPRNQEELLKALFIPICFLVGRKLAPEVPPCTTHMLWHFVGLFLIFELVVYQGRYLVNDVKDRDIDCGAQLSKQRFPRSLREDDFALKAAFVSLLARVFLAVLFVVCVLPLVGLPAHQLPANSEVAWDLAALGMVSLIAWPYEAFRSRCNAAKPGRWRAAWTLALICVVGLGYGLRAVVGMWLAGVNDRVALVLIAAGASLFGSTFVALVWALESTRTKVADELALSGKAHLCLFRSSVERVAAISGTAVNTGAKVLDKWQPLFTPWSVPAILATVVLLAFVLHLLRAHVSIARSSLVSVPVVLLAVWAVRSPNWRAICLTGLSVILAVGLLGLSVPIIQGVIAVAIATLPITYTCMLRGKKYDDLPNVMKTLKGAVRGLLSLPYIWFVRKRGTRTSTGRTHRVPLLKLRKPEGVFDLYPRPTALLVDLEGTLTGFGPSPDSAVERLHAFDLVAKEKGLDLPSVHYVTNARFNELDLLGFDVSRVHVRADKPFFTPPSHFRSDTCTVVVGDQYLTDGLLAWRFGFSFGLVDLPEHPRAWPRLQRSVGQALLSGLFR